MLRVLDVPTEEIPARHLGEKKVRLVEIPFDDGTNIGTLVFIRQDPQNSEYGGLELRFAGVDNEFIDDVLFRIMTMHDPSRPLYETPEIFLEMARTYF